MRVIPCALSIAGSDSGGGAGIQADIKTFAALGVHGMTALTSITAQNTVDVTSVQDVSLDVITSQIEAVAEDIGVDAAKTGMLHKSEIIKVVAEAIHKYNFPTVVDPVMIAKSGAKLLQEEAIKTLIDLILPLSTVLTPNKMEAETISGITIDTIEDAKTAVRAIANMGPEAVVVKGGHFKEKEDEATDVFLYEDEVILLTAERYETENTHGTGCSFSSAIAAGLAKGSDIPEAVYVAKDFVNHAIKYGLDIGHGNGPLNPMANLYNDSERYNILRSLRTAIKQLEGNSVMCHLVPEVQMDIGMALPYATTTSDVAAIDGRIIEMEEGVRAVGCPAFGASEHVARTILSVMDFAVEKRAGMNIKYSEEIVKICEKTGLKTSYYDRRDEPEYVKAVEGRTTSWGAREAIKRIGGVPDAIYHFGDWGKEPMITILGRTAEEVASRAIDVAESYMKR
ncbi:MAG: bifunctional hydroxymethylpyrimidine kinase/phosphomethylpyrimidine kinase [Candidatus Bathyarchaeia archaeon]